MLMMRRLAANRAGPARSVLVKGRDYLVAPLTLIVPGVLNGSAGALYYPAAEVAKSAASWEGMPLTLGHPVKNGRLVTAKEGGVKLGVVRKPTVNAKGRLVAEGWFDVAATRREAPDLLAALRAGERVEVSTGLHTVNDPTPGTYNGRGYDYVARDYKPDHLAVLLGEEGACSVRDGCGVFATNARPGCGPACDCDTCADVLPLRAGPLVDLTGGQGDDTDDDDGDDGGLPLPAMTY